MLVGNDIQIMKRIIRLKEMTYKDIFIHVWLPIWRPYLQYKYTWTDSMIYWTILLLSLAWMCFRERTRWKSFNTPKCINICMKIRVSRTNIALGLHTVDGENRVIKKKKKKKILSVQDITTFFLATQPII